VGLHEDVEGALETILTAPWDVRDGNTVPESEDVKLKDGAVNLQATYLYADLADSTALAQKVSPEIAARVIRAYLDMAVRIIRNEGGHIRSFDGDRVMGIFVGGSKNTSAARAALAINYYVSQVLKSRFASDFPETVAAGWSISHGIGIDSGDALIVRGGVRNNNDLVSIGQAPNVAAKLSDIRGGAPIHITSTVYKYMGDTVKLSLTKSMWKEAPVQTIGGRTISVYSSMYVIQNPLS
jgi:class 3 adenylate cyclase